jgi:leucyl aminopeptidase
MQVSFQSGTIDAVKSEAVVLTLFEGDRTVQREWSGVDKALRGRIRKVLSEGDFSGKVGEVLLLHSFGELPASRVLLVGMGKRRKADPEHVRRAMGPAARFLRDHGLKGFAVSVHRGVLPGHSLQDISQAIVEGCLLGLYQFLPYRTEHPDHKKQISRITLVAPTPALEKQVSEGARRGKILAEAVNFSRDLVNHPSNTVTPTRLAKEAAGLAKAHGFKFQVLERADAKRLGMGAFLGVAQGAEEPPKFIVMEYRKGGSAAAPVVLVGKSITFDTGGISLKPSEKMEEMKGDMAGGAAVLGTFKAVAELGLPVSLIGILPATENMPSGNAIKPGDVVTALSGLTVEVINTDAEGRLVLADGLAYAARYKPSAVIDLATLTGACVVALGHHATGILGNNESLIGHLIRAGKKTGEKLWQLPLWEEYDEQIKSDVADIKNVGGRGAGTITAAAFLGKFAKKLPWAHLDIAGTAYIDTARPYIPKGATGVGVRLLTEYLSSLRPTQSGRSSRRRTVRRKRRS